MAQFHAIFESSGIFEFTLSTFGTITIILMVFKFIKHEWKNGKSFVGICKFWDLPPHTLLALIAFIFFFLYVVQSCILSGYWILFAKPNNTFYPPLCIAQYMHGATFTIGKISLYLFWFVRLYQLFKTTLFALTKRKVTCLALIFNVPILVASWYVYITVISLSHSQLFHVSVQNLKVSLINSSSTSSKQTA